MGSCMKNGISSSESASECKKRPLQVAQVAACGQNPFRNQDMPWWPVTKAVFHLLSVSSVVSRPVAGSLAFAISSSAKLPYVW